MSTIAVYGGSFDPIQIVHSQIPLDLLGDRRADAVLVVPTYQNPLKPEGPRAPYAMRVLMANRTFKGVPGVKVTAHARMLWEERQSMYSIDLLRMLRDSSPGEHTHYKLVVGTDIMNETHRWHGWAEIVEEFGVLWVGRAGYPPPPDGGRTYFNVSSSKVRAHLEAGEEHDARAWVPEAIWSLLPGPYAAR